MQICTFSFSLISLPPKLFILFLVSNNQISCYSLLRGCLFSVVLMSSNISLSLSLLCFYFNFLRLCELYAQLTVSHSSFLRNAIEVVIFLIKIVLNATHQFRFLFCTYSTHFAMFRNFIRSYLSLFF